MKTEVQTAKTLEKAMKTVVQVAARAKCNENKTNTAKTLENGMNTDSKQWSRLLKHRKTL